VNTTAKQFAVCVDNTGYPAALEVRKTYPMLSDPDAQKFGLLRFVDESGEDYLYPAFVLVDLPKDLREARYSAGFTKPLSVCYN
jgi:hypothetical protein